jgi:N-acetylneuraminic acid mutarotase
VVEGQILILGGDDGAQVKVPHSEHRGFPRDVLAYDPTRNRWERAGDLPFSHVTTSTAIWQKRIVVPGGEIMPGVRSTEVWGAESKP